MSTAPRSERPGSRTVPQTIHARLAGGRRSFSFEFYPPKDDAGERVLWDAIRRLEPLDPAFVSVTYGAGGTTRDRTTRITAGIAATTTLTAVAHLTCVGASRAQLRQVVGGYAAAGVRHVMALRGDPPGGPRQPWQPHPEGLDRATDLVELVAGLGDFSIGVAAYPDVYPSSPDLDHDARVLAAKQRAGASFAVTQMFFDPQAYVRLVERAAAHGCSMPIIPGVMPITSLKQIERVSALVGAAVPEQVVAPLVAAGTDPARVRAVGTELATAFCARLLEVGAPGLHFYTLNRSMATLDIYRALGLGPHGGRPLAGSAARTIPA